jgi:hypothetical protein
VRRKTCFSRYFLTLVTETIYYKANARPQHRALLLELIYNTIQFAKENGKRPTFWIELNSFAEVYKMLINLYNLLGAIRKRYMLFWTAPERDQAVNIFEIKFKLEGYDEVSSISKLTSAILIINIVI